jgi:DNA repair protein RecN (Recombination protein N)
LPTVIFDEIDTGVSGDIAGKVARLMTKIAQERQLLVITHLPQIAAKAKLHYFVYKKVEGDQTYTHIKQLNDQERVEEIATMISAEKVTDAARQTAQLLINES